MPDVRIVLVPWSARDVAERGCGVRAWHPHCRHGPLVKESGLGGWGSVLGCEGGLLVGVGAWVWRLVGEVSCVWARSGGVCLFGDRWVLFALGTLGLFEV